MAEKRIEYHLDLEDVWSPDSKIQDANPLGKVPCLIMEDGGAVFDSRVISEYLDTVTPVSRLLPSSGRERAEVRTWEALGDGILDALILVRLEQTQRPSEQQSQKWIDRQMGKVSAGVAAMSQAASAISPGVTARVTRSPTLLWAARSATSTSVFRTFAGATTTQTSRATTTKSRHVRRSSRPSRRSSLAPQQSRSSRRIRNRSPDRCGRCGRCRTSRRPSRAVRRRGPDRSPCSRTARRRCP
jgi:glutathione S-transferase